MTVGCIHTTVIPQQSGIYEALLKKAERERDEARAERDEWIARFRANEQLIKKAVIPHSKT